MGAAFAPAAAIGEAVSLIRLLREAVEAAVPRDALHLRLAALEPWLRQPHRRRLVDDALYLLRGASRIRVFALPNGDVVAVGPSGSERLREAASVFGTLLASDAATGPAVARLRLPDQAAALFAAVEASLASVAGGPPPPSSAACADSSVRGGVFTLDNLAALERGLAGADLSSFLRQRPVCRLGPADSGPAAVWWDWRVALPELFAALAELDADPAEASPWLLRRLRRAVDRRLLVALARQDQIAALAPAALCLSPASIGTPEFARFAEALGRAGRAAVAIGIRAGDILADPAGFAAARDACRARGFRTALAEADPAALRLLPPQRLGLDLLQLRWGTGLPAEVAAAGCDLRAPGGEVVLCGADTAAAIGWGWEQGIALFESRLLRPRVG